MHKSCTLCFSIFPLKESCYTVSISPLEQTSSCIQVKQNQKQQKQQQRKKTQKNKNQKEQQKKEKKRNHQRSP